MKLPKLPAALLAVAMAAAVTGISWAGGGHHHHGHHHGGHASVGVYIGGPLWPWYYPYRPYAYYPPVVAVPASPPTTAYIEQQSEAPPAESYWYYCASSRIYYPYVQQCPEGWQRVVPRPPS